MKVADKLRLRSLLAPSLGALSYTFVLPASAAKSVPKQAPLPAAPALTVEELVHQSSRAYAAGDWKSAAEHCVSLLRDYGDRPELAQLAKRFQLVLLQCRLRLNEWAAALPLFAPAQLVLRNAPLPLQGELLLQKGNCERQLGQLQAARESLTSSLPLLPPTGQRRAHAILLLAACMLESDDAEAAGNLVEESLSALPEQCKEKAVLLGMQAFLKAKHAERAYSLFLAALSTTPEAATRIGVQLLLVELATAYIDTGAPQTALLLLARVQSPEKLLTWQKLRLAKIRRQPAAARAPQDRSADTSGANNEDAVSLQLEIEALGSGTGFAESTRLLSASAYRALHRHLEAALILEDTVSRLPASEALEIASLESAKTWFELERWQRVIESAHRFSKEYPTSKHASLMLYLLGCAEQKAGLLGEALATFQSLAQRGVGEFSINAAFMHAVTLLLNNQLPESIEELASFLQKHHTHSLAESTAYFLCVAKGPLGQPQLLRAAADAYLKSFSNGEHRPVVVLKRAQSLHALHQKAAAVADLEALLADNPGHACTGEAALLLGDCRLSLGDGQGALAAWRSVPADQLAAKEEGLLKCAKFLYRGERFTQLRDCLREFASLQTDTGRLAEAAGWLWMTCERDGQSEEPAAWVLNRLETLGNDPHSKGADLLLISIGSLAAAGRQPEAWSNALASLLARSATDGRHTLHSRLVWADACALRSKNPAAASRRFMEAATLHPANATSSAALADGAGAMEAAGRMTEAAGLWRELLKWHPDAPQLDRALCALARLDCAANESDSAWRWINRFEKTAAASSLFPALLLVKATLQSEQGGPNDALKTLDQLLREKNAPAAVKAEALFRIGQIHHAAGSLRVAISYLQRTYVSYARFQPWAARAYLASAEAFHALGDRTAARNTYREFLDSDSPEESPDRALAVSRLKALEDEP